MPLRRMAICRRGAPAYGISTTPQRRENGNPRHECPRCVTLRRTDGDHPAGRIGQYHFRERELRRLAEPEANRGGRRRDDGRSRRRRLAEVRVRPGGAGTREQRRAYECRGEPGAPRRYPAERVQERSHHRRSSGVVSAPKIRAAPPRREGRRQIRMSFLRNGSSLLPASSGLPNSDCTMFSRPVENP
jgi:hypothetical protein